MEWWSDEEDFVFMQQSVHDCVDKVDNSELEYNGISLEGGAGSNFDVGMDGLIKLTQQGDRVGVPIADISLDEETDKL